jgi:hypothetical protein
MSTTPIRDELVARIQRNAGLLAAELEKRRTRDGPDKVVMQNGLEDICASVRDADGLDSASRAEVSSIADSAINEHFLEYFRDLDTDDQVPSFAHASDGRSGWAGPKSRQRNSARYAFFHD